MMSSIPARTQRDVLNNHKELVPHPHLSHGLVCNIPWTGLPDRTPTSPRCLLFPPLPEATKCCRPQDIILERALLPSRGDQPSIAKNIYHKRRRIRDACLIPRTYPTTPPFPRILLLTTTTAGARRQRRKPSFGIAPGERAREPCVREHGSSVPCPILGHSHGHWVGAGYRTRRRRCRYGKRCERNLTRDRVSTATTLSCPAHSPSSHSKEVNILTSVFSFSCR